MNNAERTIFTYKQNGLTYVTQKFKGTIHRFNWHNTIELMIVLSGKMEVFANGVAYLQKENDVLLLGSNCGHAFYPKTEDCVLFTTEISPEFLIAKELPIFKYGAISSSEFSQATLLWITVRQQLVKLNDYIAEMNQSDPLIGKAIEATIIALFVDLYRCCGEKMGESLLMPETNKRNDMIKEVTDYIDSNFQEKVTLDALADITGYNKTYLTSLFKKRMGIGIYEYMIRRRMQHGMSMLGDVKNNVLDIALECGFADGHSFATYTKKYCGHSPQEYQKLFSGGTQQEEFDRSQERVKCKLEEYRSLRDDSALQRVIKELKDIVEQCAN